jgi:broad specificity phosphatase PhoE
MRLLLIRHGQTESNVEGFLDTGVPGPGLTELGHEQAAAVPHTLAGEHLDAIYVSNLLRTQLTAAPLAAERGLTVLERAGIREVSAGEYEMRNDKDAIHAYLTTALAWADGELDARLPGGESGTEVFARFDSVVAEAYAAGHGSVALVSHGAMIRSWVGARAENVSTEFVAENALGNTGVVVLDGSPEEGWNALTWMSKAIGGAELDDAAHAGPAAETV